MPELGWTTSEVMQEHLQNLMSQGYMTVEELTACRMLETPASPVQAGGYVVACAVFYEWGFDVLAHQFLCSLLQFYDLELHHLTSSGILHMAAFVILCEAYMGIQPHFNLWNYCVHARLQRLWTMWISSLDPAVELILTSTS
jgi:hypothetical protein